MMMANMNIIGIIQQKAIKQSLNNNNNKLTLNNNKVTMVRHIHIRTM